MSMTYKETPVTVTIGEKEFSKSYQQIEKSSFTVEDMLNLLSAKDGEDVAATDSRVKQVISDYLYGFDLRKKAEVRADILKAQAGPEKSIDKAVKGLMGAFAAMGNPISEEKAREMVKAQLEAKAA